MTIRDNRDYIRVLLYSYYTTITEWGVLLMYSPKHLSDFGLTVELGPSPYSAKVAWELEALPRFKERTRDVVVIGFRDVWPEHSGGS